jgi:hypothetical protein
VAPEESIYLAAVNPSSHGGGVGAIGLGALFIAVLGAWWWSRRSTATA